MGLRVVCVVCVLTIARSEPVVEMYTLYHLSSVHDDRELMRSCVSRDGHVYPQTSGHAWRCVPGAPNAYDVHDCATFFEPLADFVSCR